MEKNERRKIILINRGFQFKMIAKFIVLNMAIMLMFSFLLYLFLNSEINSNLNKAHITYNNVREMLFPIVVVLAVLNIVISSIIISGFVLFASFRIAGPLYRFNEIVREMGYRNFKPITTLRKHDQLYECSVSLTSTIGTISNDLNKLEAGLVILKDSIEKGEKKEELRRITEDLHEVLKNYRLI